MLSHRSHFTEFEMAFFSFRVIQMDHKVILELSNRRNVTNEPYSMEPALSMCLALHNPGHLVRLHFTYSRIHNNAAYSFLK